ERARLGVPHRDATGARLEQAGGKRQQRRLASPVRPDQGNRFASRDGEVERLQGDEPVVLARERIRSQVWCFLPSAAHLAAPSPPTTRPLTNPARPRPTISRPRSTKIAASKGARPWRTASRIASTAPPTAARAIAIGAPVWK